MRASLCRRTKASSGSHTMPGACVRSFIGSANSTNKPATAAADSAIAPRPRTPVASGERHSQRATRQIGPATAIHAAAAISPRPSSTLQALSASDSTASSTMRQSQDRGA